MVSSAASPLGGTVRAGSHSCETVKPLDFTLEQLDAVMSGNLRHSFPAEEIRYALGRAKKQFPIRTWENDGGGAITVLGIGIE